MNRNVARQILPMSTPNESNRNPIEAELEFLQNDRTRKSRACWIGFALAILTFLPLAGLLAWRLAGPSFIRPAAMLAALVALAAVGLGVIGIFRTRRKRRRGRVLAIFAILLGLCGAGGQVIFGQLLYMILQGMDTGKVAVRIFRTPVGEAHAAAEKWYDQFGSEAFRAAVSKEDFAQWVAATISEYGQLQSSDAPKSIGQRRGNAFIARFTGRFVNGIERVEVAIGFDKQGKPVVEDIRVGESSPRD